MPHPGNPRTATSRQGIASMAERHRRPFTAPSLYSSPASFIREVADGPSPVPQRGTYPNPIPVDRCSMIKFDEKRRHAWIASYPRSGNTWLRSFLFSLYHVLRDGSFDALDFHQVNAFCPWDNSAVLFRKHIKGPPNSVDNK